MRTGQDLRRPSDRRLMLRALALSLGLHAAAAAVYGGYQLGGYADSPPRLDVEGSTWVAISIRGEPGAAGSIDDAAGPVAVSATAVSVAEPAPLVPPPPSAPPLVAAAAPAIEAVVSAVGRGFEVALDASIESVTGEAVSGDEGDAGGGSVGGGGDLSGGHGIGDAGPGDGAGEGDGSGGGEASAGVRGLGVGGHNQPPEYPQAARLAGQEGTVIVLALSDASGAVEQASIEQSSSFPLLDEAALAAVRRWTFVPATENGVAVAGYVRVPIRFVLRR